MPDVVIAQLRYLSTGDHAARTVLQLASKGNTFAQPADLESTLTASL
jgi:hypothetical protein